ncbi:MAG: DUF6443 domain-containing protein [Bacteroidota bacterium]
MTTSSFVANWQPRGGAQRYNLSIPNINFSISLPPDITSYQILGLSPGNSYAYTVSARDSDEDWTPRSNEIEANTRMLKPTVNASDITSSSFKLRWKSKSMVGAQTFKLYVSTKNDFSDTVSGFHNTEVQGTSVLVSNLLSNRRYYFKLIASNDHYTESSNVHDVKTVLGAPIALPATNITSEGFRANWEPAGGAIKYQVSIEGLASYITQNTFLDVPNLQPGIGYKYQVWAMNSDEDWSDESNVIEVTTYPFETPGKNYVRTFVTRKDSVANVQAIDDPFTVMESTDYYDGLGRVIQRVNRQASWTGKDIVEIIDYDQFNRIEKEFLPYADLLASNGEFANDALRKVDQDDFFKTLYPGNYDRAYTKYDYLPAPEQRIIQKTAPGEAWRNKGVLTIFRVDQTNAVLHFELNESGKPYLFGTYGESKLISNTVTDEDGKQVAEFKNGKGEIILKKSDQASTYYIYDAFGSITYVLQPELTNQLSIAEGQLIPEALLEKFAFQYKYDARRRLIMKKVPGADSICMVYDPWDRLVLSQDGNQRDMNRWLFTKYDELNRPIITGLVDDYTSIVSDVRNSTNRYESFSGIGATQYTDITEPQGSPEYLTITYYDDYAFLTNSALSQESFDPPPTFTNPDNIDDFHLLPVWQPNVKGKITGTKTKIIGTNDFIESVSYFDDNYRVIQIFSENHLGGKDVISNQYDFVGNLRKTHNLHVSAGDSIAQLIAFDYDQMNRLTTCDHTLDNGEPIRLFTNTYNEIGELIEKDLHNDQQSIDYAYNIRGWLTSINDSDLSTSTDGDLFGMELLYDEQNGALNNDQLYNGNISAIKWSGSGSMSNELAYTYSYDQLNRLKTASHFENTTATTKYGVGGINYDMNGNILSLQRRAEHATNFMDDLSYAYEGNRLLYVSDASTDTTGFYDGNTAGDDYAYDANGNMVKDLNKGIDTIFYNHLNLPVKVVMSPSGGGSGEDNRIEYLYDAAGIKLQQQVYQEGILKKTTDYVGEFIYENDTLQLIQHEEGRIVPKAEETGDVRFDKPGASAIGFNSYLNVTVSSDGERVKVISNQASGVPGVYRIDGTQFLDPGKKYRFRVLGYAGIGAEPYLYVTDTDAATLDWLTAKLPEGLENEAWIQTDFVVPEGSAFIKVGVLLNNPSIGDEFYIKHAMLYEIEEEYDYQYHLKDHLGNVRLTFSTTPENYTMKETFETGENNGWQDLHRHINSNANTTTGGDEVELLQSGQTGAMIFLGLNKGDTLNLSVNANYETAPSDNTFLGTAYNSLFTSFDNIYGSGLEGGASSTSSEFGNALTGVDMAGKGDASTAPRAFLNYIYFDKNLNYVKAGFQQISTAAQGVGVHETISINEIIADREGYILAYLSNENQEAVNIHFDDFTIYHGKTNVVQTDDYYPFGLTFNSYSRTASKRNTYNTFQDQEYDEETGWVQFKWRNHQPEIGRFFNIDPLSESFYYNSLYAFSENKVVVHWEFEGLESVYIFQDSNENPNDQSIANGRLYILDQGTMFGPYQGSSFPDKTSSNTLALGIFPYNNKYGHKTGSKKGLNIVNGSRTLYQERLGIEGYDRNNNLANGGQGMRWVNIHEMFSNTDRGSDGCITLCDTDSESFFSHFNWTNKEKTTGDSEGFLYNYRGEEGFLMENLLKNYNDVFSPTTFSFDRPADVNSTMNIIDGDALRFRIQNESSRGSNKKKGKGKKGKVRKGRFPVEQGER